MSPTDSVPRGCLKALVISTSNTSDVRRGRLVMAAQEEPPTLQDNGGAKLIMEYQVLKTFNDWASAANQLGYIIITNGTHDSQDNY